MSEILTLEYNLAELPSSQHRAGLAGLVLMVRWLKGEPDKKGICEISQIDELSATLQINQEGLQYLFDKVYAASSEEKEEGKLRTKKNSDEIIEPIRRGVRIETDKKGNQKEKPIYTYPQVIPAGAFLADYDKSEEKIWLKLWQRMIWNILRGVPATRRPYDERSEGEFTEDADKVWQELNRNADYTVDLPSTYFIGAQASNAENVLFKDRARYQFLLHFWSFIAQIYIPLIWVFDRKTQRDTPKDTGYALAIPDVARLETFCDELPDILRNRSTEQFVFRPKQSVIDLAAESGLDFMHKINQRLATKVNRQIRDLLLGVDVVHLEKQGNNIRLWGTARIDPTPQLIDDYVRVKERFSNQLYRKQRMLNVLNEEEWFYGFDSLLSTTSTEQTIGQSFFRNDVRKAFEDIGISNTSGVQKMNEENYIPSLIYQLVNNYLRARVDYKFPENKWRKEWKGESSPQKSKHYELRGKLAREAFLAVRSRTESDFTEYFVSTLCSFPQFLKQDDYIVLANELHNNSEKVRTMTMLALSANGYSPKSESEGEQQ